MGRNRCRTPYPTPCTPEIRALPFTLFSFAKKAPLYWSSLGTVARIFQGCLLRVRTPDSKGRLQETPHFCLYTVNMIYLEGIPDHEGCGGSSDLALEQSSVGFKRLLGSYDKYRRKIRHAITYKGATWIIAPGSRLVPLYRVLVNSHDGDPSRT